MSISGLFFFAAGLSMAGASPAVSDVALTGVHWQSGHLNGGRVAAWQDIRVLTDGPPKLNHRLRARLVIENRGAKPVGTLLIRYSMTARVRSDEKNTNGDWAVPFVVDERRVPRIGANETIEVPLDVGAALELYSRRLARAGWWLDWIKVQAMLEPHPGSVALQTVEDLLEVQRGELP